MNNVLDMLYDTHCHPYLAKKKTQESILENFFWSWWVYLNSIWCDIKSSQISIDIAKKYSWVFATIWIHPTYTLDYKWKIEESIWAIELLYKKNQDYIVAIGESGLDYYWLEKLSKDSGISEKEIVNIQKYFFTAQIHLAKKLELPLVIHNRQAGWDIFKILEDSWFQNFIFHCYSEDLDYALKLIKLAPNCKLWFWGVVTFKNALKTQEAAKKIPLKNIIIETDSPYLTPVPHRWKQENEPQYVRHILDKIIDLRDESPEEIEREIFENSKKFFLV